MFKKRFKLFLLSIALPILVNAQWRIGVTGGATYNLLSRDNHYMVDWHYEGAWGGTAGILGQYDFNEWFGLRSEFNWTTKSYRQYRTGLLKDNDYKTRNHYFQIPVMASFRFGPKKVKGFLTLGVYGGYWLTSNNSGSIGVMKVEGPNFFNTTQYGRWKNEFVDARDNRIDYGLSGGFGVDWRISRLFSVIAETRCYYSMSSFQKDYMRIKDPRYNTTFTFQVGLCYHFKH